MNFFSFFSFSLRGRINYSYDLAVRDVNASDLFIIPQQYRFIIFIFVFFLVVFNIGKQKTHMHTKQKMRTENMHKKLRLSYSEGAGDASPNKPLQNFGQNSRKKTQRFLTLYKFEF